MFLGKLLMPQLYSLGYLACSETFKIKHQKKKKHPSKLTWEVKEIGEKLQGVFLTRQESEWVGGSLIPEDQFGFVILLLPLSHPPPWHPF